METNDFLAKSLEIEKLSIVEVLKQFVEKPEVYYNSVYRIEDYDEFDASDNQEFYLDDESIGMIKSITKLLEQDSHSANTTIDLYMGMMSYYRTITTKLKGWVKSLTSAIKNWFTNMKNFIQSTVIPYLLTMIKKFTTLKEWKFTTKAGANPLAYAGSEFEFTFKNNQSNP